MKKLIEISKSKITIVLRISILIIFSNAVTAQTYDLSFGDEGIIRYQYYYMDTYDSYFRSMVIQGDGKIVVSQNSSRPRTSYRHYSMLRYNSNGTPDSSFGVNGDATSSYNSSKNILILPDGKILNSGTRYNENGSVDSTYGVNGSLSGGFSNGFVIAFQKDGKVISGGGEYDYTSPSYKFSRYKADGFLDSAFGINGSVSSTFISNDNATSMVIQEDGKIVAGGTTQYNGSGGAAFAFARYNIDGTPDKTFGENGKVIAFKNDQPLGDLHCYCNAIALQNDGKIVATGYIYGRGNPYDTLVLSHFFTTRFNTNGTIDSTFGTDGVVITKINDGWDGAFDLAIQPDGKIVVVGNSQLTIDIVRYNVNGTLDSSFGVGGKLTNNRFYQGKSIKLQTDGKILIGGGTYYSVAIARFDTIGVLPIRLLSFLITKKEKTVLLNWQTASETNNAYFSVERSANGSSDFSAIGKVTSKGNTAQLQQYTFEDLSPLNGGNYYRLKQVDKDGRSTYSKIAFVDFAKSTTIKIYPNPVKDILQIDGLDASVKTNISIVDLSGRILAKHLVNNSSHSWNIKQLPAGNYYLTIEAGKKITTLKFIKE